MRWFLALVLLLVAAGWTRAAEVEIALASQSEDGFLTIYANVLDVERGDWVIVFADGEQVNGGAIGHGLPLYGGLLDLSIYPDDPLFGYGGSPVVVTVMVWDVDDNITTDTVTVAPYSPPTVEDTFWGSTQ